MAADAPSTGPDYSSGVGGARILVTGGSSFIGINLVAAYRRAGVSVVNADIAPPRNTEDHDVWVRTDITELADLRRVFATTRPTHVVHLAARTDLRGERIEEYDANVTGVANLLTVLRDESSVARSIVASSRMVCRIGYEPHSDEDYCPSTTYGESKVETERLVRSASGLPWVIVRPTSIWGPWFQRPYRDFFLNIDRGRYVHPTGHRIPKSFGFVGNTIWQIHRLMTAPAAEVVGRTFYAADDPPIEVGEFADRISEEIGCRAARRVPLGVLRTIARAGDVVERAGRRAPLTSFRLENLLTPMVHDLSATLRVTGPLPYDEAGGVAATVDWMRAAGLLRTPC